MRHYGSSDACQNQVYHWLLIIHEECMKIAVYNLRLVASVQRILICNVQREYTYQKHNGL